MCRNPSCSVFTTAIVWTWQPLLFWFCLHPDVPPDIKQVVDRDESPPRTPTGNAQSSESDIDVSSPSASHDESHVKDPSQKDSDSDPSHRPKRRRFHESYNFNMKCPTPGCNSLGMCALRVDMRSSVSCLLTCISVLFTLMGCLTSVIVCVDWYKLELGSLGVKWRLCVHYGWKTSKRFLSWRWNTWSWK